ncbi:MAG: DegT/DnrJ/EryC1/StrS family aminotransferase [Bdellovibrionales bacterium]
MYPLVPGKFSQDEVDAAIKSMATDQWTLGPEIRSFEKTFAQTVGSKYAVMVNSGSSANLLALTSYFFRKENPLRRGDEVLVPALAWATTWAPLWQLGLRARIVDINPNTLNVDPSAFKAALTNKTKMLMAVSILGNPCDLKAYRDLCDESGLYFLEDNCESIGATVGGKQAGTFGDTGSFSFFYSHHISTIEGGMVVTNSDETYELLLALRAHGWTRDLPSQSARIPKAPSDFPAYVFLYPGYNLRPIEIMAAIGNVQIRKLPEMVVQRRENGKKFLNMMKSHPKFTVQEERHGESSWFAFTMMLQKKDSAQRDRLYQVLKDGGIESRMITGGSFFKHPMAEFFDVSARSATPVADHSHDAGVFVGNHDIPLDTQLERLDQQLRKFEKQEGL